MFTIRYEASQPPLEILTLEWYFMDYNKAKLTGCYETGKPVEGAGRAVPEFGAVTVVLCNGVAKFNGGIRAEIRRFY